MKLYHGSNVEVRNPKIFSILRAMDFGPGFYLTTSEQQAGRWAKVVTRRRAKGEPIVNIYEFDESKIENIEILKFEIPNEEWLDFVVDNRKAVAATDVYDLVIGPVANDSTLPVIDGYMDGIYTTQEAVKRLLPQRLTDQYAFLTDKALGLLKFERSVVL